MIPIYYHIPKCGGTYIYTILPSIISKSTKNNIVFIDITKSNKNNSSIVFRFILTMTHNEMLDLNPKVFFKNKEKEHSGQYRYSSNIVLIDEIFNTILLKNYVKFIMISSAGFKIADILYNQLDQHAVKYKQYMTIRDVYDKAMSMYHYLSSTNSKHERQHWSQQKDINKFVSMEQNNWLVENILNLKNPADYNSFMRCVNLLNNFFIRDISNINDILTDICLSIGLDIKNISYQQYCCSRNQTIYDKPKFTDFPNQVRINFLNRTRWDREIYAYFT